MFDSALGARSFVSVCALALVVLPAPSLFQSACGGARQGQGATGTRATGPPPAVATPAPTPVRSDAELLDTKAKASGAGADGRSTPGTDFALSGRPAGPRLLPGSGTAGPPVDKERAGVPGGTATVGRDAGGVGSGSASGAKPGVAADPAHASPETVTVRPTEIGDVLYNPGMGFADFHFARGDAQSPDEYPPQTVAYFRWTWDELEPSEGRYDFDRVDDAIRRAKARGETLAFRIMAVHEGSTPRWLLGQGVDSVAVGSDVFPDHNDPVFLACHERLLKAFGDRYAGAPEIDHVDIGSVGCWGEWNTACCPKDKRSACKRLFPTAAHQLLIVDWYLRYFPRTPLVMLVGGPVEYAVTRGAGWRGDCFGDYGMFSSTWNHMDNVYERAARHPVIGNAWKIAPVQFEVCGVMGDWQGRGFDIDLILEKGLEWHISVLNAKSSPVPAAWREKVDGFLKRVGYRFVLREMTHAAEARPAGALHLRSLWENKGVAPIYRPWPLAYRLRSRAEQVVATWRSAADLTTWLPGTHAVEEIVTLPAGLPAATYSLDVAILTEDAKDAHVEIAIAGKRPDGWYAVSAVTITR